MAHSLGCLIVRAALLTKTLKPYRKNLHSFLSLCGPHLGIAITDSALLSSAIWIYKKWNNSVALTQLQMLDAPRVEESLLMRLARSPGMDLFKNVLLFSSEHDKYAPLYSALLLNPTTPTASSPSSSSSSSSSSSTTSTSGATASETMRKHLLDALCKASTTLVRTDVEFVLPRSIEHVIGRAAHVNILSDETFVRILTCCFIQYMR